jgi:dTDP-L-rhamnose 4-epimerase
MTVGRVLITGGAGFIGSWLTESLVTSGAAVRVIDSLSPQIHGQIPALGYPWLSRSAVDFRRGDVRDVAFLNEAMRDCEVVVHLAAETGTGQSMYQIAHYYEVNVQATAALFEGAAVRHPDVRKIILASSRSIYGEGAYEIDGKIIVPAPRSNRQLTAGQWDPVHSDGRPLRLIATPEFVEPRPASIYAATKVAIEQLGAVVSEAYGKSVTALRFQNVFGERQSLQNPYTGILSIFSNRMRQGLPISVFEDGKESRDFVHVMDVVRAIRSAIERPADGFHAVNIGSGQPTSVREVAERLKVLLSSDSEIKVSGEFRSGDIRHCYADLTRARALLGYTPSISLEEGLERFVGWAVTQPLVADRSREAQTELVARGLGRAAH